MRTVGIDLAAEPAKTAVAVIDWSPGAAVVRSVALKQTDDDIADLVEHAHKVGIDCPLGWPEPFIEFLSAQRDGAQLKPHDLEGRRLLTYRETDRAVVAGGGPRPLSVAADRIGHAALRAAGLLGQLGRERRVDRAGGGLVVEVYPAAALRHWGLNHTKYKGGEAKAERKKLIKELTSKLTALDFGDTKAACVDSDDALDAVVCALIARAAALGEATRPDQEQAKLAATEGWIAVPTCELAALDR
jgi:predicted nuclease with RNAse H fold